ncbi:preprotein translocase subunit YajC [Corynebacterium kalidii]
MEFILLILIVLVFLGLPVLSMRKQSKQINEIKSFQAQLEPGMIVQMTSGIHARISEVGTTTVDLEVAPGVTTTWDRSAVLKLVETPDADTVEDQEQVEESSFEDFDTVAPFENPFGGSTDGTGSTDTTADRRVEGSEDRGEDDRDSGDTPKS